MKEFIGFKNGVNLGGWLSQCDYRKEHLESFINEKDIERIASWGCDHVRLPFDYNIILDDNGKVLDSGMEYLTRCVGWCEKHGLNIILDLHKTMGFSFDKGEQESGFFDNEHYQDIFVELWCEIAKRFADKPRSVAFELLNEITERRYAEIWNRIAARTISAIRGYAPENYILIGGIFQNSVFGLTLLDKPCDEHIVFNFHYYNPLVFTHQKAYWIDLMQPDCNISYPDSREKYLTATLDNVGSDLAVPIENYGADTVDKRFIEAEMSVAHEVGEKMNVPVYCGEYGVIDKVPGDDMLRWYDDICSVFNSYNFGRAVWNYKEKDFGITDNCRTEILPQIVKYLAAGDTRK